MFNLATGGNGCTNSCAESSDGAAWTMIGRVSYTVRQTSKVPSEVDITRQVKSQSSVKAFNLLRIAVFDCPVQDSGRQLDEMQAWSLVSFSEEDGIY